MKQVSTRSLFHQWNVCRGSQAAPERTQFDLAACDDVLGDAFVLNGDSLGTLRLGFAGTRLCNLFGTDLRGQQWPGVWEPDARSELADFIRFAIDEQVGTVAGVGARTAFGTQWLELVILPFMPVAGVPARMIGALSSAAPVSGLDRATLGISSWRHVGPMSEPALRRPLPRAVRKLKLACGFLAYEGARA